MYQEDDVDPRDIDKILSELAGMAGRWGLFRRFLCDRLKVIFKGLLIYMLAPDIYSRKM